MTKAYKIEHCERIAKERDRLDLAVYDLANDLVTWSKWFPDDCGGYQRIGLSRMEVYGIMFSQFKGSKSGRISTDVMDFEYERENFRKLRQGSEVYEPICAAIRDAIDKLPQPLCGAYGGRQVEAQEVRP